MEIKTILVKLYHYILIADVYNSNIACVLDDFIAVLVIYKAQLMMKVSIIWLRMDYKVLYKCMIGYHFC